MSSGTVWTLLRFACEFLAAVFQQLRKKQLDKERDAAARDGAGALIGLLNPESEQKSSAPANSGLDGKDEQGR